MSTRVRVNLGVENKDVYVFARSDNVVQTAVTDVVRGTVATDNPLRTLNEIVVECFQFGASFATFGSTSLDEGFEFCTRFLRCVGVVFSVEPFVGSLLKLGRHLIVGHEVGKQHRNALAHLLVAQCHTHTKLAEVFEQRVVESRTLTSLIGCVRR